MIAVLGGLADVERDLIRTRTAEGRSRTQKHGQHMGRPKLTDVQKAAARRRRARGATLAELAGKYDVGKSTISRLAGYPRRRRFKHAASYCSLARVRYRSRPASSRIGRNGGFVPGGSGGLNSSCHSKPSFSASFLASLSIAASLISIIAVVPIIFRVLRLGERHEFSVRRTERLCSDFLELPDIRQNSRKHIDMVNNENHAPNRLKVS